MPNIDQSLVTLKKTQMKRTLLLSGYQELPATNLFLSNNANNLV